MDEELELSLRQRVAADLRGRINSLLTSALTLAPLVEKQGDKLERRSLYSINRSLFSLLRTAQHLELLDDPSINSDETMVNIGDMLEGLFREIYNLSSDLECDFQWRGEDENLMIWGDSHLLTIAILNVVSNAIQAVKLQKSGTGSIKCQWKRVKRTCQITITDNGPGLEAYWPWQGLGIGLQVARRCLELHGGTLMLNSSPTGVTAVITLPLKTSHGPEKLRLRDRTSGFSPLLTELAPYLPSKTFHNDYVFG